MHFIQLPSGEYFNLALVCGVKDASYSGLLVIEVHLVGGTIARVNGDDAGAILEAVKRHQEVADARRD